MTEVQNAKLAVIKNSVAGKIKEKKRKMNVKLDNY